MTQVVQLHRKVNPAIMLDHERWNADLNRPPRRPLSAVVRDLWRRALRLVRAG